MNEYSRKVFIGGLQPDMDQDEIIEHFLPYGPLSVDWPYKAKSKAAALPYFTHKGYAFLIYEEEVSVHLLVRSYVREEGKLYVGETGAGCHTHWLSQISYIFAKKVDKNI